jgi:hypothetical protein
VYFYILIIAIFCPVTGKATAFPEWHNGDNINHQIVNSAILYKGCGMIVGFAQNYNNVSKFRFENGTQPIIFGLPNNKNTPINCDQSTNNATKKGRSEIDYNVHDLLLRLLAIIAGAILGIPVTIWIANRII